MTDVATSTQIVILGGSGDLSRRKLLPALLDLFVGGNMPKDLNIIALARTPRTSDEYRAFVTESIHAHKHNHSDADITLFCSHLSYVTGNFDEMQSYEDLNKELAKFETLNEIKTNKLFYLAVPPKYYDTIFKQLSSCCVTDNDEELAWSRILVEKPFGENLKSAQELEKTLSSLFQEKQIFRIDHYLAKEAVQNILSFRFANVLFKNIWDKNSIKEIHIKMHEDLTVETRGSFYDGIGALRDVGQNHLLQLLALIAMKEPTSFSPDEIRAERAKILGKLKPISDTDSNIIRAQYVGYLDETGVAPDSDTETYFKVEAYIDSPEWEEVPFYIEAGKGLAEKCVIIEIVYKDIASGLFDTSECVTAENTITLSIDPKQAIEITFNAKKSGYGYQLEQRNFTLLHQSENDIKNSYEKVLLDCIAGDQTLFTSTEEVFASWNFITPILEKWGETKLRFYKKGSNGFVEVVQ